MLFVWLVGFILAAVLMRSNKNIDEEKRLRGSRKLSRRMHPFAAGSHHQRHPACIWSRVLP